MKLLGCGCTRGGSEEQGDNVVLQYHVEGVSADIQRERRGMFLDKALKIG